MKEISVTCPQCGVVQMVGVYSPEELKCQACGAIMERPALFKEQKPSPGARIALAVGGGIGWLMVLADPLVSPMNFETSGCLMFFGAALGIFGTVFALDREYAWWGVGAGVLIVLVSLLLFRTPEMNTGGVIIGGTLTAICATQRFKVTVH